MPRLTIIFFAEDNKFKGYSNVILFGEILLLIICLLTYLSIFSTCLSLLFMAEKLDAEKYARVFRTIEEEVISLKFTNHF